MRSNIAESRDRWCLAAKRDIYPELQTVGKPVSPRGEVVSWQYQDNDNCCHKSTTRLKKRISVAWGGKHGQELRKFINERRDLFIFMGLFVLIFGLAWWATEKFLL